MVPVFTVLFLQFFRITHVPAFLFPFSDPCSFVHSFIPCMSSICFFLMFYHPVLSPYSFFLVILLFSFLITFFCPDFFPDLLSLSSFWSFVLFFHLVLSLFFLFVLFSFRPVFCILFIRTTSFYVLPSRVGFDIPAYHSITVIDLMPALAAQLSENYVHHTHFLLPTCGMGISKKSFGKEFGMRSSASTVNVFPYGS
jgi:hypothetical protein